MAQITIEINGRPYVVGCEDGQERRLAELAALVDAQVRQVARDVGPLGETRLMLMGALVMADDISELTSQLETLKAQLAEARAERGRAELAAVAALDAAAARIEAMATS
ncbi:MAG TPA: cell division protein ZapA [Caulobacteraceae bacterium]|jgi:cell division protein ZapA|nr:cell division protein ZapA [Caulobacteraceae bacterium]